MTHPPLPGGLGPVDTHQALALAGAARFDRAAHLRTDRAALDRMQADPSARMVVLWNGKPLIAQHTPLSLARLPLSQMADHAHGGLHFIGLAPEPIFAVELTAFQPDPADSAAIGGFFDHSVIGFPAVAQTGFMDLRQILTVLSPQDSQLAATACGLLAWHRTHSFCSACGQASAPAEAGWQRRCASCHRVHFPRTDPVVIMLIQDGDAVLLARSLGWPEGFWSLPAGFVEPGESVEAAVQREVLEETGIHVGAVQPLLSQSWPFPASLMIGCMAPALSRDIIIDCNEIDAAEWVSRAETRRILDGQAPSRLPPRDGAIARHILERWVEGYLPP